MRGLQFLAVFALAFAMVMLIVAVNTPSKTTYGPVGPGASIAAAKSNGYDTNP